MLDSYTISNEQQSNLDLLLAEETHVDQAVKNVIQIGRLLGMDDTLLSELIERFEAFQSEAFNTAASLRDADIEAFKEKYLLLDPSLQKTISVQFIENYMQATSFINQYNLFQNILNANLFNRMVAEIDNRMINSESDLSMLHAHFCGSIPQRVKSRRRQKEILNQIDGILESLSSQEERIEQLQMLLSATDHLDESELAEYFKLPLTINELFDRIQKKVQSFELSERAMGLLQYELKSRFDAIPTQLCEENLMESEMGAENFALWQKDQRFFKDLTSADSLVLSSLKQSAEKKGEELDRIYASIFNAVRLDQRSMVDVNQEAILKLLKENSNWDPNSAFENQKASLEHQKQQWNQYNKAENKILKTHEELAQFLAKNPLVLKHTNNNHVEQYDLSLIVLEQAILEPESTASSQSGANFEHSASENSFPTDLVEEALFDDALLEIALAESLRESSPSVAGSSTVERSSVLDRISQLSAVIGSGLKALIGYVADKVGRLAQWSAMIRPAQASTEARQDPQPAEQKVKTEDVAQYFGPEAVILSSTGAQKDERPSSSQSAQEQKPKIQPNF